eukprot:gene1263-4472_t
MDLFWQGHRTHHVPKALHKKNRDRLATGMKEKGASGVVILESGHEMNRNDSDHELLFRQESYFHWAFGCTEAGMAGLVDIDNNKSIIFIPRLPEAYAVWMGKIQPPATFVEKYGVDEAFYVDEIPKVMKEKFSNEAVHVLYGKSSDSGSYTKPISFEGIDSFTVDQDTLFPVIANLRVFKTQEEVAVMRFVNQITSEGHVETMRQANPGMIEYQLEAIFKHHIYYHGGCRNTAYTPICASGPNSAILHYGHAGAPNDRQIQDGDIMLLDLGAEYHCYAGDITCSFPANGKFTDEQKIVYQGVLNAVISVEEAMKPGVSWPDMQLLANRCILAALIELGCLEGDVEEMMSVYLGGYFMPHGLGHFLGIDTHDVGGYLPDFPARIDKPGLRNVRTARILEEGMVMTVEPGLYFIDSEMDKILKDPSLSKFANVDRLNQFRGWGGVRLEDNVIVTADGIENMSSVPRAIEEVESVMAGGTWPPTRDQLPSLRRDFTSWTRE